MNSSIKKLVDLALREVGTREAGGNNLGPKMVIYQKATWLKPGAWPWCAAFTCWLMQEWLKDPLVLKDLKLPGTIEAAAWRCKDASAYGWEKWANMHGVSLYPESVQAKAGDFVTFDFSHIGLVVEDQVLGSEFIKTVEGNTNGKGERDSLSGDGVWKKTRRHELVKSYIRIIGG